MESKKHEPEAEPEISAEELHYRELRRRFKRLFGYKPCGLTSDELQQAVDKQESRRWQRNQ